MVSYRFSPDSNENSEERLKPSGKYANIRKKNSPNLPELTTNTFKE